MTLIIFLLTVVLIIIFHIIDRCRKDKYISIFKQDGQIYHPSMLVLNEYILYLTERYEIWRSKKKWFLKKQIEGTENGQIVECSDSIKLAEMNNNKDIEKIINNDEECHDKPNTDTDEKPIDNLVCRNGEIYNFLDFKETALSSKRNLGNSEVIKTIKNQLNISLIKNKQNRRVSISLFNENVINKNLILKRDKTVKSSNIYLI